MICVTRVDGSLECWNLKTGHLDRLVDARDADIALMISQASDYTIETTLFRATCFGWVGKSRSSVSSMSCYTVSAVPVGSILNGKGTSLYGMK